MEHTDGNCKYKIEKIGVVLKNEPIQVSINSDHIRQGCYQVMFEDGCK